MKTIEPDILMTVLARGPGNHGLHRHRAGVPSRPRARLRCRCSLAFSGIGQRATRFLSVPPPPALGMAIAANLVRRRARCRHRRPGRRRPARAGQRHRRAASAADLGELPDAMPQLAIPRRVQFALSRGRRPLLLPRVRFRGWPPRHDLFEDRILNATSAQPIRVHFRRRCATQPSCPARS